MRFKGVLCARTTLVGGGLLVGAIAGNAGLGAAIETAAGGFIYDRHRRTEQSAYQAGYPDGRKGTGR